MRLWKVLVLYKYWFNSIYESHYQTRVLDIHILKSMKMSPLFDTDLQWRKTLSPYLRSQYYWFPSWIFQKAHPGLQKGLQSASSRSVRSTIPNCKKKAAVCLCFHLLCSLTSCSFGTEKYIVCAFQVFPPTSFWTPLGFHLLLVLTG